MRPKHLGETIAVLDINLAQFPEDQNKENRDHEQEELDAHWFLALWLPRNSKGAGILLPFCSQKVTR